MGVLEEDSIGAGTSRALYDELTEDDLLLKSRLHRLSLKLNFKEEAMSSKREVHSARS